MFFRKKFMLLIIITVVVGFTSCSNDDDEVVTIIEEPTGSFTLPSQPLDAGMVIVEDLSMNKDGWIVVRRDNGSGEPIMSEIISIPEYVEAGDYDEFSVQLEESVDLTEGEKLWVNLHVDDGDQIFEYDGTPGKDMPVLLVSGNMVKSSFIVDLPDPTGSVSAEDQMMEQNRRLTINSVDNSHSGWVVVYSDAEGEPFLREKVSIPRYVEPGTHTDLDVELEESAEIDNNGLLWVVLHIDDGDQIFEYNGVNSIDEPVLDTSNEIVKDSFNVSFNWSTGSLTVSDQVIEENNIIIISSVEMDNNGWLVLHEEKDGTPFSTETVSEPLYMEAGSYQDVELTLKETTEVIYSKQIWAALYSDDGDGVYEYEGTGEIDAPFIGFDGTPVAERFTVYKASSLKYFLLFTHPYATMSALPLFENEPGWLVVYRDNGNEAPDFSEVVSKPQFIEANSFALLDFESGVEVSGQEILWIVLHSDDGDGIFEYDGSNGTDPPAEDENGQIIMQSFQFGGLTWL